MFALTTQRNQAWAGRLAAGGTPARTQVTTEHPGNPILAQQRALGNQAMQRLLRASPPLVQRKVSFDASCEPYIRCAIYEGIRDARRVAGLAVSELAPVAKGTVKSGRIIDLLNVHFHVPTPAQIAEIHTRFQKLSDALKDPPMFKCLPYEECRSPLSGGFVGGKSTVCRGGEIEICPDFKNTGCTTRSHMILHEMAHHELCAAGDVYAGMNPGQYMSLSSTAAMDNADSYAQFADMVDMGSPICRECYLPKGARPTGD